MKKFVILLVIISMSVFGITLSRAIYYIPPDEIILPIDIVKRVTPSKTSVVLESDEVISKNSTELSVKNPVFKIIYPSKLSIPKINVNAKIQQVGITKKQNVSAPYNFTDVGWYKYGTFPGDIGNSIIDGHVDNGLGFSGVFSNLKNLNMGDDIYITIGENENAHFIVTKSEIYDFDTPINKIYTETDKRMLKLITCAGEWITEIKTHNKRLVVSAILVE